MYDVNVQPDINKEYILDYVSQINIMEKYLGVEVQTKHQFRSPIRKDKNPTCNFSWYNGILYYMDWGRFQSPKDCWNVVMYIHNINYWDALDKIAKDFNLLNTDSKDQLNLFTKEKPKKRRKIKVPKDTPTSIKVKTKHFSDIDKEYLSSYHITSDACKRFRVYSIGSIWINDYRIYTYTDNDPALGYYFGVHDIQRWKIYFYKRDIKRFVCNTNIIQGYKQLPKTGEYCIITKSMKDVMCLWEFSIPAIAPHNEKQLINEETIKELQQRFKRLFVLFDFDYTGISGANRYYRQYSIPRLFFTNGRFYTKDYGVKDFSDYVQNYGKEQTRQLIKKNEGIL